MQVVYPDEIMFIYSTLNEILTLLIVHTHALVLGCQADSKLNGADRFV